MSSPRLPRTTATSGTLSASKDDGAAIGSGHTMSAFASVHSYVSYSTASYRCREEPCFDCCDRRDAWSPLPGSSTRRHLAGCLLAYSYALVIAAAMATTVHWMRDMVAGLCIGMAIAIAAAAMPFGPPPLPLFPGGRARQINVRYTSRFQSFANVRSRHSFMCNTAT
eukprot:COSAG05_NODE_440_length_9809_cov_10.743769_3_plen_167_part_00